MCGVLYPVRPSLETRAVVNPIEFDSSLMAEIFRLPIERLLLAVTPIERINIGEELLGVRLLHLPRRVANDGIKSPEHRPGRHPGIPVPSGRSDGHRGARGRRPSPWQTVPGSPPAMARAPADHPARTKWRTRCRTPREAGDRRSLVQNAARRPAGAPQSRGSAGCESARKRRPGDRARRKGKNKQKKR